jgi:RNA polymerase sigma-70 factor, ECF subfamily
LVEVEEKSGATPSEIQPPERLWGCDPGTGRRRRPLRVSGDVRPDQPDDEDPWDVRLESLRARDALDRLAPHHRAALTLRYLDDLPVDQVAEILDRTVHATEALLVRSRAAFRQAYTSGEGTDA